MKSSEDVRKLDAILSPLPNMNLTPAPPKRDYKNPLLKDPYSRVSPVSLSIVVKAHSKNFHSVMKRLAQQERRSYVETERSL